MLNREKTGLEIFDQFHIDYELPKHKKALSDSISISGSVPSVSGIVSDDFRNWSPAGFQSGNGPLDPIDEQINFSLEVSKRFWKRIFKKIFGWIFTGKSSEKNKVNVLDFFKNVKNQLENIDVYKEKIESFLKVAEHAKKAGQIALYEEIMKDTNIVKNEALLLSSNFKTCIKEDQIVTFYKESEKGLRLHYVKNFTRMIPEQVVKLKEKADNLMVFDNYVVLYYDKDAKTFKETQAEFMKRKDPILFGVIRNSRKLYYIADWVDEFCDLTLNDLINKFGNDAIKASDISVNYKKD